MNQRLLILPIIVLYGLFSFRSVVPVMEFGLNRQMIVANKCLQRNNPVNHCQGKCQLMKQLAAQTDDDAPLRNTPDSERIWLFHEAEKTEKCHFIADDVLGLFNATGHYRWAGGHLMHVFQPPEA